MSEKEDENYTIKLTKQDLLVAAKHARDWKRMAKSLCRTEYKCSATGFA